MEADADPPPTPNQKRSATCLFLLVGALVVLPVLSFFVFPSPHLEVLGHLKGHDLAAVHSAALGCAADDALRGAYGEFEQLFAPQPETRPLEAPLPAALLALHPRAVLVKKSRVVLVWGAESMGGAEVGLVLADPADEQDLRQAFGAAALQPIGPGAWSLVTLR